MQQQGGHIFSAHIVRTFRCINFLFRPIEYTSDDNWGFDPSLATRAMNSKYKFDLKNIE